MRLASVLQQSLSISFSLPQLFPTLMPTCRKNSTHKFCSGNGIKSRMMVMVCFLVTNPTSLSLSVVPSQFNQMLLKGGFFSTHLHTVSKASWVYHVFPSIRGFLFDSTVQYLFWVDKGKIGWLIQQRFPFQDSLGGTRWPIK